MVVPILLELNADSRVTPDHGLLQYSDLTHRTIETAWVAVQTRSGGVPCLAAEEPVPGVLTPDPHTLLISTGWNCRDPTAPHRMNILVATGLESKLNGDSDSSQLHCGQPALVPSGTGASGTASTGVTPSSYPRSKSIP